MNLDNSRSFKFLIIITFALGLFFSVPDFEAKAEVGPCALYGIHKMHPSSTAKVTFEESGRTAIGLGTLAECACGATVVYSGYPPQGMVGYYVTDPTFKGNMFGHAVYTTTKYNYRYTSSSYISGYRFY